GASEGAGIGYVSTKAYHARALTRITVATTCTGGRSMGPGRTLWTSRTATSSKAVAMKKRAWIQLPNAWLHDTEKMTAKGRAGAASGGCAMALLTATESSNSSDSPSAVMTLVPHRREICGRWSP